LLNYQRNKQVRCQAVLMQIEFTHKTETVNLLPSFNYL
jgi:hypothetical protein